MAALSYQVQYIPDPVFWSKLSKLPLPKGDYPEMLTLGNQMKFAYAPGNVLKGYTDWTTPGHALHYLIPQDLPAPVTSVGYLFAPLTGVHRKVYVAFFYGVGHALLAQTHPMTLVHKPLGLRFTGGGVLTDFTVSNIVIKGDAAPIHMVIDSPKNPELGLTLSESPTASGQSVLSVSLRIPGMASASINPNGAVSI
jgi:hypothetical protein